MQFGQKSRCKSQKILGQIKSWVLQTPGRARSTEKPSQPEEALREVTESGVGILVVALLLSALPTEGTWTGLGRKKDTLSPPWSNHLMSLEYTRKQQQRNT